MATMEKVIGVFDSGVGGLTVLKAFTEAFPNCRYLYLGDTARVPYGTKSSRTVEMYAEQCAEFLRERGATHLVIACNTVSALALSHLQEILPLPVLGMVEGAVRQANSARKVGVIGTRATISSGAYARALVAQTPDAQVQSIACPLFVPLAEEGWEDHKAARLIAEEYLTPLRGVEKLILGCTHFPLLQNIIQETLPETDLICCGSAAVEVARARWTLSSQESRSCKIFVTDRSPGFTSIAQRFFGEDLAEPELVDLSQRR